MSTTRNAHSPGTAEPKVAVRGLLLRVLLCIAVLTLLGGTVQWLARSYRSDQQRVAPTGQVAYVDLPWETLIPKGWDPTKRFRDKALGESNDTSQAAMDLERQMRETWDNAPTNRDMNGARVRLVGYVVPLEASKGTLSEFLLVPYFGACIHVPPPPANQIVHVSLAVPAKGLRTMDSVWVTGTLRIARNKSVMGMSGYSMDAVQVEPRAMKVW